MTGEIFRSFRDDGRAQDVDYLLTQCEGFRVETTDRRRVGVVAELHWESRADRPDVLIVATGALRRRRTEVRAVDVERVLPREKLVVVRSSAPLESR